MTNNPISKTVNIVRAGIRRIRRLDSNLTFNQRMIRENTDWICLVCGGAFNFSFPPRCPQCGSESLEDDIEPL